MLPSLAPLEALLAQASEDAQYWNPVCDEIVRLFDAQGVILVPAAPQVRGIWMACSIRLGTTVPEYLDGGWHLKDPREAVTAQMIERGLATDDDVFPDRRARAATPFYREFLCKHNFGVLFAQRLLTPNGHWGLMLHCENDRPPITDAERDLFNRITPRIEAAITRAAVTAQRRIADFTQFFRGTASDVFIYDIDGQRCFSMDRLGQLRARARLDTLLPEEVTREIAADLREICLSAPETSYSKAYQFRLNGRHNTVLVIQIPPSLRHFFMPFKVCAIRTECSESNALRQKRLRDDFDLSSTEITTVDLLASGKSPAAIADLMSLKPASVRQRLKKVYEKVEVNSQVELIALYSRL